MLLKNKLSLSNYVGLVLLGSVFQVQASTELYWGDTHLHTSLSFDAFLGENQSADPDTAYRWAKGEPVIHPFNRARVQIQTPLDFLVVSDHAEFMGVIKAITEEKEELGELGFFASIKRWIALKVIRNAVAEGTGKQIFKDALPERAQNPASDPVTDSANKSPSKVLGDTSQTEMNAWVQTMKAAEDHYQPGKFTTFLGWEWSSIPTGANLHRVVITPDGIEKGRQYLPFGADQSMYPQDLWAWLDETSKKTGSEFIAIPHNSNISKGYMFPEVTLRGEPIDVNYARTRMAWEPVVEITQFKGDSETHAELSPNDEFSDFESYEYYIQKKPQDYVASKGSFVRSALGRGLQIEKNIGVNPYKFGVIGSTDSHTGLSSAEENNFWGKTAYDSTPQTKRGKSIGGSQASGWDMQAGGLTGVWAKENTREEIYAAFKRREVYATTGPRISLRMFASWNFDEDAEQAKDLAELGYRQGIAMGGDLIRPIKSDSKIQLLIQATKDPKGANLDRVQVVKGWLDSKGGSHEKVFNVSWAGERTLNTQGKLKSIGNSVNTQQASYTNNIGAPQLTTLWSDPEFNINQRSFYYLRVLEIPTPRHSLYDAVALQIPAPKEGPEFIQERAYSSPIWYTP